MPIISPPPVTTVRIVTKNKIISTTGGSIKVTGYDSQPAAGRTVLLLGRNVWGRWAVIAETLTDGNGDYTFSVPAGANDRYVVVGIGNAMFAEYSFALGNMEAVVP